MKTVPGVLHQNFISLWYSRRQGENTTIITVKEGDAPMKRIKRYSENFLYYCYCIPVIIATLISNRRSIKRPLIVEDFLSLFIILLTIRLIKSLCTGSLYFSG